jgi:hypothetical protein
VTTHQALDKDALRALLSTIRSTSWSWQEQEVPALVDRFGWTDILLRAGRGALIDPGHELGDKPYRMSFDGSGKVNIITMRISSVEDEDDPEGQLFLGDVFADAAAVATEILGTATVRTPGSQPEIRWRGEESTLILYQLSISVELTWASNEYQDHWDELD